MRQEYQMIAAARDETTHIRLGKCKSDGGPQAFFTLTFEPREFFCYRFDRERRAPDCASLAFEELRLSKSTSPILRGLQYERSGLGYVGPKISEESARSHLSEYVEGALLKMAAQFIGQPAPPPR